MKKPIIFSAAFGLLSILAAGSSALELSDVNADSIKAVRLPAGPRPEAVHSPDAASRSFMRVDKCWARAADKEADSLGLPAKFCLSRLGFEIPTETMNIFDNRSAILAEGPGGLRSIFITGYANYGDTSSVSGYLFPGGRAFAAVYLTVSRNGTVLDKAPEIRGFIMGKNGGSRELPYAPAEAYSAAPVAKSGQHSATGSSGLTGFLTRFNGEYHVGSNLYFEHAGNSRLVEDLFTRIQQFSLRGRDLYISVKGYGEYRLGAIDLDPSELKERETRKFRLTENISTATFYYNWRVPKVGVNFSAGITGFGLFTEVAGRTQTSISVKTAAGLDFCHYQNIPGRANGVLYPGACAK